MSRMTKYYGTLYLIRTPSHANTHRIQILRKFKIRTQRRRVSRKACGAANQDAQVRRCLQQQPLRDFFDAQGTKKFNDLSLSVWTQAAVQRC